VSDGSDIGKLVLGGAVGFGLYLLVTGLGFGGRGKEARADGRGQEPTDQARLNFLLTTHGFELRDADWKSSGPTKIFSRDEAIARVKAGGRSDVTLKFSGDAIQRDVTAALAAFKAAGIDVWKVEGAAPPARVGNARGVYGRSW